MNIIRWFTTPQSSTSISKKNFLNVQIDAFGIGLANAIAPFLPILLARAGASAFEVGLLTSIPAVSGFLLAIPMGRFLQQKSNIIPWFSLGRLTFIMGYAIIGICASLIPSDYLVTIILVTWTIVTIPQTLVGICFNVVMNSVAGPEGRLELMSHRWSILGAVTGVTVFIIGLVLDKINFPLNYTLVFISLSIGGWISYFFSSHIKLNQSTPPQIPRARTLKAEILQYINLLKSDKPFVRFISKRFVFMTGGSMVIPLFPLYFVREINTTDSWIAIINTSQTIVLVIAYVFWAQQSRSHGSRYILLWTTFILSLYPIMTAFTTQSWLIAIFAGISGIFQAGLNLVFFDELLRTVPPEFSATFISVAQSLEYFSMIIAPLIGSLLAEYIGISSALVIGGTIRLFGFFLFFIDKSQHQILIKPA